MYDGNVYEGPQEICQGFARYFKDLGKPKVSSSFYEDHRVNVEADVAILQEKYLHQEQTTFLTISQVTQAVKDLNSGKVPDADCIAGEHLFFAADAVAPFLTELFNGLLSYSYIPTPFLRGSVRPIWKKKGGTDDPTKYRGITISSTVGKVY